MSANGLAWMIGGVVAGFVIAILVRRYAGRKTKQQATMPRPPASRQERRRRERDAGKRGR